MRMKELKNCDINKLSKEELALFGLVEITDNVELEIENNSCEDLNEGLDCSTVEATA